MTARELIWGNDAGVQGARDKLDDKVQELLWSDSELIGCANTVLNEWCRETGCLRDDKTTAICQIPLLANVLTYPMDNRIIQIHNGWLDSGWAHIDVKDEIWLDRHVYMWRKQGGDQRFILPDYSSGYMKVARFPKPERGYFSGAFTFAAASNSITQTGTNFTVLVPGDKIVVSGTVLNGTTAAPSTFTIVTSQLNFVTVIETIADESAAAAAISKIVDNLNISVSRLPLNQLTLANWDTQSPEIRFDYHPYLIEGILREAYQKQDSQCLDVNKSEEHGKNFQKAKDKAYNEIQRLRQGPTVFIPNPGRL